MRMNRSMNDVPMVAAIVGVIVVSAATVSAVDGPNRRPFKIVCTVGMVTDIARNSQMQTVAKRRQFARQTDGVRSRSFP